MKNELVPKELQDKIVKEVEAILKGSAEITEIETPIQFQNAGELRKKISRFIKASEIQRLSITKPDRDKVDKVNAYFNEPIERLKTINKNIDRLMIERDKKAEAKRITDQSKRDEETRKAREIQEEKARKAEQEQQRLMDIANEKRQKAEKAKNEATRKKLEAEAKAADIKAGKEYNKSIVAQDQANNIVSNIVESETTKVKGRYTTKKLKGRIIDESKLITFLVKNKMLYLVSVDTGALNRKINSEKGTFKPDGVEIYDDTITGSR